MGGEDGGSLGIRCHATNIGCACIMLNLVGLSLFKAIFLAEVPRPKSPIFLS